MDNLDAIYDICKLNFWEWDITKNQFEEVGYFGSFKGPFEAFLKKVYPADRNSLEETIHQFSKSKALFEKTFRILRNDNSVKWLFIRGRIRADAEHKMNGIILGINNWKENEDKHYMYQLQLMELIQQNMRNGIISMLAHELTQPLMVINTYLSGCIYRLKENRIDNTQLVDIMNNIKQHAVLMGDKIHELKDFLNVSLLDYNETNIHEVIQESVMLLSYELQTQAVNLNFEFQENLPSIKMDRNQIKQVLYNLFKNSIANMSDKLSTLVIKTKKIDDNTIKIIIKDNNKKNPKTHKQEISTLSNKYRGLKIGIDICRTIIEAHGGTLSTKSSSRGNNYQFTLHS